MKSIFTTPALFFVCCYSFASTVTTSTTLLQCSPPSGSRLQEIKIVQIGDKVYRSELNFAGSRSDLIQIKSQVWAKKDLSWLSPDEGRVHMKLADNGRNAVWLYVASNPKSRIKSVNGSCLKPDYSR